MPPATARPVSGAAVTPTAHLGPATRARRCVTDASAAVRGRTGYDFGRRILVPSAPGVIRTRAPGLGTRPTAKPSHPTPTQAAEICGAKPTGAGMRCGRRSRSTESRGRTRPALRPAIGAAPSPRLIKWPRAELNRRHRDFQPRETPRATKSQRQLPKVPAVIAPRSWFLLVGFGRFGQYWDTSTTAQSGKKSFPQHPSVMRRAARRRPSLRGQ